MKGGVGAESENRGEILGKKYLWLCSVVLLLFLVFCIDFAIMSTDDEQEYSCWLSFVA